MLDELSSLKRRQFVKAKGEPRFTAEDAWNTEENNVIGRPVQGRRGEKSAPYISGQAFTVRIADTL